MAKHSKSEDGWSTGVCDCLVDTKTCCYGFWCCPCMACNISGHFQENVCLPLCDILGPGIMAACGLPCFVPPAALGLRVAIRHKYKIKGTICKDICVSCFCVCCSWCQMEREIKARNKTPVPVNNVVNTQPGPMMMMMSAPAPVINQTVTVNK